MAGAQGVSNMSRVDTAGHGWRLAPALPPTSNLPGFACVLMCIHVSLDPYVQALLLVGVGVVVVVIISSVASVDPSSGRETWRSTPQDQSIRREGSSFRKHLCDDRVCTTRIPS